MDEKKSDFSEDSNLRVEDHSSTEVDVDVTDAFNRPMKTSSFTFAERCYKMNHPKRGKAIIFNHFRFINNHKDRRGTESDVKNLKKALLELGFRPEDINIHNDLTASSISDELQKVQKEDHTNRDVLMIFVLTHGTRNEKISASDVEYPIESLWEPFKADKCRSLAGKPKIFFVIACRGEIEDQGQRLPLKKFESDTEVDAKPIEFNHSYSIPVWSDFLYVFSTYKGYVSYRHVDDGTWFIQAFCEELSKTNISETSFTDFLTAVNGRLSGFETGSFWNTKKQIPTFSSTLTKRLYFVKNDTKPIEKNN